MKKWFSNMGDKIQYFMQGRYGYDELSRFLYISGLVLLLLSCIPYLKVLYFVAFVMMICSCIRTFSRNIYKRQMERQHYLTMKNKIKQKFLLYRNAWRDRKTHKYYRCPYCKAIMRISRPGKGKTIAINCMKCGQRFEKRT